MEDAIFEVSGRSVEAIDVIGNLKFQSEIAMFFRQMMGNTPEPKDSPGMLHQLENDGEDGPGSFSVGCSDGIAL